jgi:hypothetical protein
MTRENDNREKLGFFQLLLSAIGALFGIQSEEKRKQDFEKGDAGSFIVIGIIMVVVLIVGMITLVSQVVGSAGAGH